MAEVPKLPASRPDAVDPTGSPASQVPVRRLGTASEASLSFALAACCGIAAGLASTLFLGTLDAVTSIRWRFPWLLMLLPVAGVATVQVYRAWGRGRSAAPRWCWMPSGTPGPGFRASSRQ